jgi:hypothetical protein
VSRICAYIFRSPPPVCPYDRGIPPPPAKSGGEARPHQRAARSRLKNKFFETDQYELQKIHNIMFISDLKKYSKKSAHKKVRLKKWLFLGICEFFRKKVF